MSLCSILWLDFVQRLSLPCLDTRHLHWHSQNVSYARSRSPPLGTYLEACEQYQQTIALTNALNGVSYFFAAVFVLEAVLKLYAMVGRGPAARQLSP